MVKNNFLLVTFLLQTITIFSQDSTRTFYAWPVQTNVSEKLEYRYKQGDSLRLQNGNFQVMSMLDKSSILFKGSFKNSKKEGLWTYYYDGVQISATQNYRNDTLNGISHTYDKEGLMIAEINYENGEMHGPFLWKDFVTNLGFAYGQFNRGLPTGIWKYIDGGELLIEVDYSKGRKNQVISRYKNGKMYQRETYKNQQLIGTEEF